MSNTRTVESIYEAFGRGDIPFILGTLSETVEWEYGLNSTDVPWLQPRKGRAAVAAFFESLAALDFRKFQVNWVGGSDNIVVGLCDVEAVVRNTGKTFIEADEVHIWHFGEDGLVTRFRHRVDTYQHWQAYHGG